MGSIADPHSTTLADSLEALASQLAAQAKSIRDGTDLAPATHHQTLVLVKAASQIVSQPRDDLSDMMMGFVQSAAIRLFIEWDVFSNIPVEGAISYVDLARMVGADASIIKRLCWILVANGKLQQQGHDSVAHTAKSLPYRTSNPLTAMMKMGYDEYLPSITALLDYYKTFGRTEPTGKLHTVKAFAVGQPERTVSDLLNEQPERIANMMLAMTAMEHMYPHSGVYDFSWVASWRASNGDEGKSRPLIVDVGGAKGFTLQAICKDTPGLPITQCVLEDLPEVIDLVKSTGDSSIKSARLLSMDFHKGQPVQGALVYLLRRCLHDFGDDDCVTILKHIAEAMAPDSKLLIGDTVIQDPPSPAGAMVDFFLSTIGGKERTLDGFRQVVAQAGLRVTGVFPAKQGDFTFMECVKA
ncbi:S-adenosyl-L-methionine-dependent methyltransferase [Microdochium bolleyi]|uniref:S-adenosyl-L-methionine-dependent methyltransferase n=1 Tax=Microdochium bolleyi TaxID=196109 RepID=A0A136ISQ9_9PEZI|nr:S-adenosyl-L-methionine-dependent methyltransferase [Microdochium bolleyi]